MAVRAFAFFLLGLLIASKAKPVGWQTNGVPACTAAGTQVTPSCVSDGSGGAIIVWMDCPHGFDCDIYAQRITRAGAVAPGWLANGVPVCVQPGPQGGLPGWFPVAILSDGFGGAFIAWHDYRNGTDWDIYLQRITPHGDVASGWPSNGLLVCDAPRAQSGPAMAPDGTGGVFVVWADNRAAPSDDLLYLYGDLYAQRVSMQGSIAPGWPDNGVAVSTVMNASYNQTIVADGSGGAFIAASELERMSIHRITSSGANAPGWPAEGVYAGPDPCHDGQVQLIVDGVGGVIAAWEAGPCLYDDTVTHVQRLTGQGLVAPGWPPDAFSVQNGSRTQLWPRLVTNGDGSVFFTWDNGEPGVYLQQLDSTGTEALGWPPGQGISLTATPGIEPDLVADGSNGVIVAWSDGFDVLAQRRLSDASMASGWPVAVAAAPGQQGEVRVTSDDSEGAIFVWSDTRNGNYDIYCLRIGPNGQIPTDVDARFAHWDVGPPFPNPFSEELTVNLTLPLPVRVKFQVFDASGRRVFASYVPCSQNTQLRWRGRNQDGMPSPNGVYFLQISSPMFNSTRKVVISR